VFNEGNKYSTCGVPNCERYGCVLKAFIKECEECVEPYDIDVIYELARAYQNSYPSYEGLYKDCISLYFKGE
jgi:hypothetical protein